jgi:Glycosyl transferase family 64 domain
MSAPEATTAAITASSFWGLTTFFNPERYRRRKAVYDVFRGNARRQGLQLLTVELAFGDAPFELGAQDAEVLIHVRAGKDAVMWQKERLLNVGLSHLPAACNALAWLDCDVLFDNRAWVTETVDLLRHHAVVQPFSMAAHLPPGRTTMNIRGPCPPGSDRRPGSGYAFTYGRSSPLEDPLVVGHAGFAWAARRSLFDGLGFYDRMIGGGGAVVLACGFFGRPTSPLTHLMPDALIDDQRAWIEAMSARVRGSVRYTRGGLLHLWHGTRRGDATPSALRLLRRHSFDPRGDIRKTDSGCFVWTGGKPELAKGVARRFWLRNEDGDRLRERIGDLPDKVKRLHEGWSLRLGSTLSRVEAHAEMAMLGASGLGGQKVSLIILNWKRPKMVSLIVDRYSTYSAIGDIVVWSNSHEDLPDLSRHPRVKLVTCRHNAGVDARWAAAMLADEDRLLVHDDDLVLSEPAVTLLVRQLLRRPHLCHGIRGRDLTDHYNYKDVYGRVDVVLTTCLAIDRRYVPRYFDRIALFDDLREYGCGNGEDIAMNYIVRSLTREKNRAYHVPFVNANTDHAVSEVAISRRRGHLAVRNEIARRCVERLMGERASLRIDDFGLDELSSIYPPVWSRYFREPDEILRSGNFVLSETVAREKFARALSLLCRRHVRESELG